MKKCSQALGVIIFILLEVETILFECPESSPILKQDNSCAFIYCSESELKDNKCSINNTKIKTQWINNVIIFGELNFRYINFGLFSNGDLIVETTPCPGSNKRRFYGLKSNGRALFRYNNTDTHFYRFAPENEDNYGKKYEGEIVVAKLNEGEDKDQEYIVSMSKAESYAELYDFEYGVVYKRKMSSLIDSENQNYRQVSLTIQSDNNLYYSLYGFINDGKLFIYKLPFPLKNSIVDGLNYEKKEIATNAKGGSVSCFKTKKNYIICFYYQNDGKPVIHAMNNKFELKNTLVINNHEFIEDSSFIKCTHFYDEIGVFSFFDKAPNDDGHKYPYIYLKNIKDNNEIENPVTGMPLDYIILNHFILEKYTLMNEITTISDEKVCFTGTTEDHETLVIVVLSIINLEKIKIRYYSFPIYQLINYKFLSDMRSFIYNKFIMIGSSVCRQSECNDDHNHPHESSLIIFSYPNSTDVELEISEFLLNNNDIKIDNLEIDLKDYIIIENNIFGLIYYGIQINNISSFEKIKLYSTKHNTLIANNSVLEKDENIKIKFENNIYLKDNVSFIYYYIIIEPDRNVYDQYTYKIDYYYGNDTDEYFNSKKNQYIGRASYFTIYLNKNLKNNCIDSKCGLCFEESPDVCITCKSNYYLETDQETIIKKCNHSISESEDVESSLSEDKTQEIYVSSIWQEIQKSDFPSIWEENQESDSSSNSQGSQESDSSSNSQGSQESDSSSNSQESQESDSSSSSQESQENGSLSSFEESQENDSSSSSEEIQESDASSSSEEAQKSDISSDAEEDSERDISSIVDENTKSEIPKNDEAYNNKSNSFEEILTDTVDEVMVKNCSIEEIIDNLCNIGSINNEQSENIYKILKENCLNMECASKNKIVTTGNIIYQMSTYNGQKNNINISSLDLGDCEDKLRKKYSMSEEDEFIILKKDIKNDTTTYVEYEIYNSANLKHLNLDVCNDTQISINVPVNLNNYTEFLYEQLYLSGYNLFDGNDSFYNDICATYTTEDNTDILLSDRKKNIYKNNGNITLCQEGCHFNLYSIDKKQSKCSCNVQQNNTIDSKATNSSDKLDKKNFGESFYSTLKNSNFMVLKCYKLAISLKNIFKNIGRIIMTVLLCLIIILIFLCIVYEIKKISNFISTILGSKLYKSIDDENILKRNSSNLLIKSKIGKSIKKSSSSKFQRKKRTKKEPPLRKLKKAKSEKKKSFKIGKDFKEKKSKFLDNNSSKKNLKITDSKMISSKRALYSRKPTIHININNLNFERSKKRSKSYKSKNIIKIKQGKLIEEQKISYNDRELNSLKYEEALKYDKRSYFQYYCSLLLQKHLILFTFYSSKDYNLYTIKIILFLLSFSLYFSVNGLFFSDDTMHKLYEDRGKFDIIFQIPQIIYSAIVSGIINTILKQLSLSDKNMIALKQEKEYNMALKKSKVIKGCLYMKFIIFFILSLSFMLFFWYFISCFCAVFSNTQIILIKDTCLSFGLSMIYPFGLNLLPGFFRLPAIKAKNKNMGFLYKFSLIVAII